MGSAKAVESIMVNVAREEFRRVLADYENIPGFIDELDDIRVDSANGDSYVVTYFISILGRKISYALKLTHHPPGEVCWELVRGDYMKKNQGRWVLEEVGPRQTLVHYHIEMGFGMLVPDAVVSQLQRSGLPKMLQQYKQRAEALYGAE